MILLQQLVEATEKRKLLELQAAIVEAFHDADLDIDVELTSAGKLEFKNPLMTGRVKFGPADFMDLDDGDEEQIAASCKAYFVRDSGITPVSAKREASKGMSNGGDYMSVIFETFDDGVKASYAYCSGNDFAELYKGTLYKADLLDAIDFLSPA